MPFETTFLGTTRRDSDDVIDYFFRVWDGITLCDVAVGIAGQAINPEGKPARTKEVLIPLADAWFNYHLDRGFDPFTSSSRVPDVTASIADYWCDHRKLPPSL